MFQRMFVLLAGVAMMATATGCCCLGGCLGGYNRCNPCYSGYGASPCGPGGCAPTYGMPPTGYAPTAEYTAAFAPTTTITSAPAYAPAYTTTVLAPSLPTY